MFNLARTDVAGFELYAQKVAAMFGPDDPALCDLMEGSFTSHWRTVNITPGENAYLEEVARIFGMPEERFLALRSRMVPDEHPDPYQVLGVPRDAPMSEIRKAWRNEVRESHPDRMIARGVPEEAIKLAEKRLIAVNRAWDEINSGQG